MTCVVMMIVCVLEGAYLVNVVLYTLPSARRFPTSHDRERPATLMFREVGVIMTLDVDHSLMFHEIDLSFSVRWIPTRPL